MPVNTKGLLEEKSLARVSIYMWLFLQGVPGGRKALEGEEGRRQGKGEPRPPALKAETVVVTFIAVVVFVVVVTLAADVLDGVVNYHSLMLLGSGRLGSGRLRHDQHIPQPGFYICIKQI